MLLIADKNIVVRRILGRKRNKIKRIEKFMQYKIS